MRYVITPDVAMRLAGERAVVDDTHQLVAPTLIRSQLLSLLYRAVRGGGLSRQEAEQQLDYVRGLRLRLLGDRVLQSTAWRIAEQLGWADTYDAEYIALTKLQADALIALDNGFSRTAQQLVRVATFNSLLPPYGPPSPGD